MTTVEFELTYAGCHTRIKPNMFMELVQKTLGLSACESSRLVVTQAPLRVRATAEQFTRFLIERYNIGLLSGRHANGFCELQPKLIEPKSNPHFLDVRGR